MFPEENSFKDFSPFLDDMSRRSRKSPRFRLLNMSPEIQNVFDFDLGAPTNFCINYVSNFDAEKATLDILGSFQVSDKHQKVQHSGPCSNRKIRKTASKPQDSKASFKRHQQDSRRNKNSDYSHQDSATHFTLSSPCLDDSRSFKTTTAEPTSNENEPVLRQVNWRQFSCSKGLTLTLGDDSHSSINFAMRNRVETSHLPKKRRSVSFFVRRINANTLKP